MNWNDAIQQLAETHWNPKNRVVAAKDGLSVLVGLDERIQEALKQLNASKQLAKQSGQPVICGEQLTSRET